MSAFHRRLTSIARGLRLSPDAEVRRRIASAGATVACAAALTACGGGGYLSYDVGGYGYGPGVGIGVGVGGGFTFSDDGRGPSVQISSLPSPLPAGGTLVLGATALDPDGISEVNLFRIDGGGFATFVASDRSPPYEWATTIPADGRGAVSYFARATDGSGRVGDSAVVTSAIRY